MPDIGKCVRVKATGWVHSYSLYDEPRFDPEIEEVIECESLDAAKPQFQKDRESAPQVISPWQARKAFRAMGVFDQVQSEVAAAPEEIREAVEYATEIRRTDATLLAFVRSKGWSEQQVDDFFRLADTL